MSLEPGQKAIRHLSITRAKGPRRSRVAVVGKALFGTITKTDDQFPYFIGASRAGQLLVVVNG